MCYLGGDDCQGPGPLDHDPQAPLPSDSQLGNHSAGEGGWSVDFSPLPYGLWFASYCILVLEAMAMVGPFRCSPARLR